jgi:hypothetical protein
MREHDVYWIRSHDHEDLVGDRRALEPSFLHEVSCEQRGDSVRLPPVDKLRSRELRLRTSELISLEYFDKRKKNRYATPMREEGLLSLEEGT